MSAFDVYRLYCLSSKKLGYFFQKLRQRELTEGFILWISAFTTKNLMNCETIRVTHFISILGVCFEELKDELKCVYAVYCRNHDDVTMLLEKVSVQMHETYKEFLSCISHVAV